MLRKRRQFIQVKGNSAYSRPVSPNAILKCPTTGIEVFCRFPVCQHFVGGPIHLREGAHKGSHQGFGFQHIWQEHFSHETDRGAAEVQVFGMLRSVLVPGASIHYEGGTSRDYNRASISIRSAAGLVIVEERRHPKGDSAVYSIVTVYTSLPKGTIIGRIEV